MNFNQFSGNIQILQIKMPPGGHFTSDSDLESVISLQVGKPKVRHNSGGEKYFCSIDGCTQSFPRLDHLDRHEFKHTGIVRELGFINLYTGY